MGCGMPGKTLKSKTPDTTFSIYLKSHIKNISTKKMKLNSRMRPISEVPSELEVSQVIPVKLLN